jgi:hypothetical protein
VHLDAAADESERAASNRPCPRPAPCRSTNEPIETDRPQPSPATASVAPVDGGAPSRGRGEGEADASHSPCQPDAAQNTMLHSANTPVVLIRRSLPP